MLLITGYFGMNQKCHHSVFHINIKYLSRVKCVFKIGLLCVPADEHALSAPIV